ncbi:MAG: ABC transporter permease, partial [Actinobacteria bacterium]
DIALGEALWATTRAMIYGGAFIVIALPFGVFHSWLGVFTPPAMAIIGLMFAFFGLAFTYAIRVVDYLSYYWTLFLTPMFMFSGIFFPLDKLPGWVKTLSWFMPLRHAVDLMRALLLTGEAADAARAALWIVVVTLALFVVPLNLLRRRLET